MDHLLLPEGIKPWIVIAYDGQEEDYYEKQQGKGFFDFPKRLGWVDEEVWAQPKADEDLMGGVVESEDEKHREPWEVEKFFQTWLFFGLIIEVFTLSGISVSTDDFLVPFAQKTIHKPQKSHIVTTTKLPSMIVQWREKHQASRDTKIFDDVMKLLDHVGKILDHHCASGKDHRSIHQYGKVLWPVKDETTTSIIAVASTLRKAARLIYNPSGKSERWPVTNSKLLYLRIQRKWCKSDAAMIMEDFDIDGQYYIAAADSHSLDSLDGHYSCTDHSCEAKISDGTYVTKHVDACSGDDYEPVPNFVGQVYPSYGKTPQSLREAIIDIMDARHLPFLRWDSEQHGLATYGHEEDSYAEDNKTPPYVAISHVWANGMGNPFDNSLPCCQLEKIQKLVDDLCINHLPKKPTDRKPGFWMDTLCCLVGMDEKSKHYKDASIKSMRKIYHEAVAVLIIDPWLMSIPSTASMAEVCHRVYAAGWSRRLWTHQEGFLGKEVYYQLQDKPLSLSEVNARAKDFQRKLASKGQVIGFPFEASDKTSFYYTGIKTIIDGIREGRFSKEERWIVYRHLAESLGYRSTTNIDDELLCVASVIGLDVGDYSRYSFKESRQRTAEKRMQVFLEEIGRFRQGIIFNNYRRLTIPGFRWAPLSLLGHRSSGLGDLDDPKDSKIQDYSEQQLNDKHVEIGSLGMKINLNKSRTKGLRIDPRVVSLSLNNGKKVILPTVGLPVDYPGYTIKFSSKGHGLTIDMAERRFGLKYAPVSNTMANIIKPPPIPKVPSFGKVPTLGSKSKLGGLSSLGKAPVAAVETVEKAPVVDQVAEIVSYQYVVYVADNDVKWEYDRKYALILQKPLGEGSPNEFLAMVGLNSVGPGDRTWVQSLCSAIVRVVRPSDSRKITAGIDFVDVSEAKTNWVVT